jgi:predicted N-acyltransferase
VHVTIHQSISEIPEARWDALLPGRNPFLTHRFLNAMEVSGCVGRDTGWQPRHFVITSGAADAALIAAMPCYEKSHSYGEYVFDWAWADAYHNAGLDYYPKLLCAVPFTPVTGPRLLFDPSCPENRESITKVMVDSTIGYARDRHMSSIHWLFTDEEETTQLMTRGLIQRVGSQFHWENNDYEYFGDFLAALTSKKRKNIKRERRRVTDAGIEYRWLTGPELDSGHWDTMYNFYLSTIYRYGARTYLNRELFGLLAENMSDDILLIFAYDGDRPIAGGIYFLGDSTLYGRYWGSLDDYHSLHFETCYYQPIEYCIVNGLQRFEAGAQGSHKLARGLLPSNTYSVHWLADPRFADAVSRYTREEQEQIERYTELLNDHSPFRRSSAGD